MTLEDLAIKISNNILPAMIVEDIEKMESYQKYLRTLKSKCKPLKGSEKQIAWAEKIRKAKLENAAFKICVNNAMKKGAEQGLKNCPTGYDYSAKLQQIIKEAYEVIVAESWIIIDNNKI